MRDEWIDGSMDVWMMERWTDGWMDERKDERMDRCMDGGRVEWRDGRLDG